MAKPEFYVTLSSGSSGPDVALVQTWLNGLIDSCTHYAELAEDGKYGPATVKAVQEFQVRNDLAVDGKTGKNTWNALYAKYAASHADKDVYPGTALREGDTGAAVRAAQQQLKSRGSSLTADAKFGDKTEDAVRAFQKAAGINADGVIGPDTWAKLFARKESD